MKFDNFRIFFKNKIQFNFAVILLFVLSAQLFLPLGAAAQKTRQLEQEKSDKEQKKTGKRIALVIGNSNYQNVSKLANPVNDARGMAAALKDLGFEVMLGEDMTFDQMISIILDFGGKIADSKGGVGLFYYAGHGIQVEGRNFLIPVEFKTIRKRVELDAVDLGRILREMEEAKNRLNIVILDACRNNPFESSSSSISQGLAETKAPKGTFIAYATAPGQVASDGDTGKNGLFTAALLKQIKIPNVELEAMFKKVSLDVNKSSGEKQTPWRNSSLGDEFFLSELLIDKNTKSSSANVTLERKLSDDSKMVEQEAWNYIKNSDNPADFRTFLKFFSEGANAAQAKRILEQLVWDSVANSNDKASLKAYLDEFAQGVHAGWAKLMLYRIENGVTVAATTSKSEKAIVDDDTPVETQAWESIKNETNAELFRLYIKEYPKGEKTAEAQNRLEEIVWEGAKSSWDKIKIQAYLDEFPQGKNTAQAKKKLDKIAWEAVRDSKDKAKLSAYLKEFPEGDYASPALIEIKKIETVESDASTELDKNTIQNVFGMKFVYIKPGQFLMGASNQEVENEKQSKKASFLKDETPQRNVTIKNGFYMGKFEVTQEQWESVMGNNPSINKFSNCPKCPVENVSWNDAKEFIRKLNENDDDFEYRLPTEAEWEYAARAGTTTIFAFGNTLNSKQANINGNSPYGEDVKSIDRGKSVSVASYGPNPWEIYDMHGNVAEWCEDVYTADFNSLPTDGSANLKGDAKSRVIKGGSWLSGGFNCRSGNRDPYVAEEKFSNLGFRVVAEIKKK